MAKSLYAENCDSAIVFAGRAKDGRASQAFDFAGAINTAGARPLLTSQRAGTWQWRSLCLVEYYLIL